MLSLPKSYRDLYRFCQRLILFVAVVMFAFFQFDRLVLMIGYLFSIALPFILGTGFAFVLNIIANGIHHLISRIIPIKNGVLMKILAILVVLSFFFILFFIILPGEFANFEKVIWDFPNRLIKLKKWLLAITYGLPDVHHAIENFNIYSITSGDALKTLDSLSHVLFGNNTFMESVNSLISTTISWMLTTFLALTFGIFVLFNKKVFKKDLALVASLVLPKKGYRRLRHIYDVCLSTFTRYVGGTLIECLILATMVGIGASILHLRYATLGAVLVGVGALVPMFGALVAACLVTVYTALSSPFEALTFILMFVVIQQIEGNFIYPNVVGRSIGFPPMYVVVAVVVGASFGGILGMVVFIPLSSAFYQLLHEYQLKKSQK